MGQDFSGSSTVTSRNSLILKGATTATKSEPFDPKGVHQALLSRACHCVEDPLATANFREFGLGEVRLVYAATEPLQTVEVQQGRGHQPHSDTPGAQEGVQRRSWWSRVFRGRM